METQLEETGNGIGNQFPENGNTSGKNWKFPIFSNSKAKICSGC